MFISSTLFLGLLIGCISLNKKTPRTPMLHCPTGYNEITLSPSNWTVEYSGYGNVEFTSEQEIDVTPRPARTPQSTHASLVLSKLNLPNNFDVLVEYKNNRALRKNTPNPWEVFWLFFQYQKQDNNSKITNYIVAKTNGVELGKAFGETGQEFIKTVEKPHATFNEWHLLRLNKTDSELLIELDGQKAMGSSSQGLFQHQGRLGLYSEDAAVTIRKVCLN